MKATSKEQLSAELVSVFRSETDLSPEEMKKLAGKIVQGVAENNNSAGAAPLQQNLN